MQTKQAALRNESLFKGKSIKHFREDNDQEGLFTNGTGLMIEYSLTLDMLHVKRIHGGVLFSEEQKRIGGKNAFLTSGIAMAVLEHAQKNRLRIVLQDIELKNALEEEQMNSPKFNHVRIIFNGIRSD